MLSRAKNLCEDVKGPCRKGYNTLLDSLTVSSFFPNFPLNPIPFQNNARITPARHAVRDAKLHR